MAKSMLVNLTSALNGGDNLQSHGNGDERGGTCTGARLRVQFSPRVDHSERSEAQRYEGDRVRGGRPIFVEPSVGTVFQSASVGNHALAFFDGVVPSGVGQNDKNGNGVDFGVSVQVPQAFTQPTFTLRQHYSVRAPEPATLALLGLGFAGLAAGGRRRRD